jgi:hypothetical protein
MRLKASREAEGARIRAQLRTYSGVYVFSRASDGVKYTCDLRQDGVCFLGVEILGTSYSTSQGDITAALTRDGSGRKRQDGYKGRWEIRDGRVYLFTDGELSNDLAIQGRNLVTDDGALYARAE